MINTVEMFGGFTNLMSDLTTSHNIKKEKLDGFTKKALKMCLFHLNSFHVFKWPALMAQLLQIPCPPRTMHAVKTCVSLDAKWFHRHFLKHL